jgi:hypothetical protein
MRSFSGRAGTAWTAAAAAVLLVAACGSATPRGSAAASGSGSAAPATSVSPATSQIAPAGIAPASSAPASSAPASSAPASAAQEPDGQPCDPRDIAPLAASFVSPAHGFLLGVTLRGCTAVTASKIVLRGTADGGLHWTALPAPPAPWGGVAPDGTGRIPADGVSSVLFADPRDGWAYGPGLWATHDGGVTWHRVITAGRAVQGMTATDGQAIASLESCDPADASCDGPQSWVVTTTPAGRDAWRPVPGESAGAVLAAQAGTGYAVSPGTGQPGTDVSMITGPADGSAPWVSRPLPCQQGAIALTAVSATRLLLACALLGAHPATTNLYASPDAGRHWQRFAVLGLYDGASLIGHAPDGTVLVAGIYDGIKLSRDGGRTWARPAAVDDSLPVQAGGPFTASLLTSQDGYAIRWLGPLWITRDGGRTWTQVPVH